MTQVKLVKKVSASKQDQRTCWLISVASSMKGHIRRAGNSTVHSSPSLHTHEELE